MTSLKQLYEIYPADPRATMPVGIRVDDLVFGSVSGVDPLTARHEGDLEEQARAAVIAAEHLLERGGFGWQDVQRIEAYTAEASVPLLSQLLTETLAPQTRLPRVFAQPAILRAGQRLRLDVVAGSAAALSGLRLLRLGANSAPAAVRIGPLLYAFDVTAVDASTGRIEAEGTVSQVAATFLNLNRVLEAAGMGEDRLLRIAGFLRDLGEKDVMNGRMVVSFSNPAQRPVHKYVPAALPLGIDFALQAIAVEADERRIVEMEGIKHNDPISLGAIAGNVFVSSRVQARPEPGPREQAARLIEGHARKLVEHVGGSLEDITQTVWGIGDAAFEAPVREECDRAWPEGAMPRVDVVQADFPHSPLPRLEFFALLGRKDAGEA